MASKWPWRRSVREKPLPLHGTGPVLTPDEIIRDYRIAFRSRQVSTLAVGEVMLGRAIFGNPWLFHPQKDLSNVGLNERFAVLLEHTRLFEELLPHKNFAIMKKHYKAYVNGFDGAKEFRNELMECANSEEMAQKIAIFLSKRQG